MGYGEEVPDWIPRPSSAKGRLALAALEAFGRQGFAANLYFSSDQTCCTGDTVLTSVSKSGVVAGGSYTETRTVTIPNVAAGTYYLILKADHVNGLYEANETNNQQVVPLTVSP